MLSFQKMIKVVSVMVSLAFLSIAMYTPAAEAAMVSTDLIVNAAEASQARQQIDTVLLREDVKQALLDQGVKPDEIQARVASLSDEEALQVAEQLEQLPAGGDGLGVIVFVFLVLIVTDIVCLTNIFPFTVKHCR